VNVETPFPTECFTAVLTVHFLVNSLLSLVDGSNMFCHVALSGEHFITVGTGDALDSAMFGLSHVDVSYVGAQVGLGGEYPDTHVAPLVARVVSETAHLPGQLGGQTLLLLLNVDRLQDRVHVSIDVVDDVLVLSDVGSGVGVQDGVDRARGK